MKKINLLVSLLLLSLFQLSAQAERLVLVGASYGKNILAICTEKGDPIWQYKTEGPKRGHTGHHDVHLLPNGNILFHDTWTSVKEITLDKKIVWEYDCAKSNGNQGKRVDVHAFARLKNGNTVIIESGVGRVIEVDKEGISVDGTSGSITIVSNGPDFDEPADGQSDYVEGRFIFEQTDDAEGVFQIVQSTAVLSSNGQKVDVWGGGLEMSILFRKDGATSGEAGQFVMIKNDGSTEQGDWDAEQIRDDFSF